MSLIVLGSTIVAVLITLVFLVKKTSATEKMLRVIALTLLASGASLSVFIATTEKVWVERPVGTFTTPERAQVVGYTEKKVILSNGCSVSLWNTPEEGDEVEVWVREDRYCFTDPHVDHGGYKRPWYTWTSLVVGGGAMAAIATMLLVSWALLGPPRRR